MNTQKVLLFLIYCIVLIPALPPVFVPLFEPYTFGKTELFEIAVEIMALCWMLGSWRNRKNLFAALAKNSIAQALFFMFAAFTLSSLLGAHPLESFWGSSARNDGLFTFAHFMLFFTVLVTTTTDKSEWRMLMRWSVGASVFAALYGLAQWFALPFVGASEGVIFSTLGNPAYFATYLSFHVFIALFLAYETSVREIKIAYGCVAALEIIVILLTQVSAPFLGLVVGLCIAAHPYVRYASRARILAILGIALVFIPLFFTNPTFESLSPFGPSNKFSAEGRLRVWNIAAHGAMEQPFFGHGANQFEETFLRYTSAGYAVPATGETFDKPHNAFLEVLFNYGMLGFAAYLSLLWIVFSRIGKIADVHQRQTARGMAIAYLISLFFLFDTLSSLLMFFFFLAFLARQAPDAVAQDAKISGAQALWILVLTTVLFYTFHFKSLYTAYYGRALFIQAQQVGMLDERLKAEALRYPSFNSLFIKNGIALFERRQ